MARIIAFCGRAGSGKTTAANIITEHYDVARVSFASALRVMILPLLLAETEGNPEAVDTLLYEDKSKFIEVMGMTTREALQKIGSLMRQHNPDVFVRTLDHQLKNFGRMTTVLSGGATTPDITFVIDDLRYDNEAAYLKNFHEATIIRLQRSEEDLPEVPDHESERGIDDQYVDVTLSNTEDYAKYRQGILGLAEMYDLSARRNDSNKETARVH